MRPPIRAALLAVLWLSAAPAATPAQTPADPGDTPPESCLALETYPVPAGDAPHDVAPATDDGRV